MALEALSEAERRAVLRGEFVRVALHPPARLPSEFGEVRASSAFVGVVDGTPVTYANLCRHRPSPLDLNGLTALSADGAHLVCSAHGARFRLRDGVCVEGPCHGAALHRL